MGGIQVRTDWIIDGQGDGEVASALVANKGDLGRMRPFVGADGRTYHSVYNKATGLSEAVPVNNAAGLLTKDGWILLDDAVEKSSQMPLQAWNDLRSIGTRNVPNPMGHPILQYQQGGHFGNVSVSMDGDRESERNRGLTDLKGIPLPIIHCDFWFTAREMAVAEASGMPLDTDGAAEAGRAIGEQLEAMTIGTSAAFSYGGYSIPGMTSLSTRNTATLTLPTTPGWTPRTLIGELLAMKKQLRDDNQYGPFFTYFGGGWDPYLDDDYSDTKGEGTLRDRVAKITDIGDPRTLRYIGDFKVVMVQKDPRTARAIVGQEITTVSWPGNGGFRQYFKILCILVPQYRSDYDGQCGINDGTAV